MAKGVASKNRQRYQGFTTPSCFDTFDTFLAKLMLNIGLRTSMQIYVTEFWIEKHACNLRVATVDSSAPADLPPSEGIPMSHALEHARHADGLLDRRSLLRVGSLECLGLSLPGLLRAEAARATRNANIRSCILLYYYGGPSHLDTWDLKPDAPAEIRGEFEPIATRVPGFHIGEHLPRCARLTDKLAVIRSFHHPMRNHNAAAVESLCGRTPLKGDLELLADDPNSFPCYGASLSYLERGRPDMPSHVALPHVMRNVVTLPGQNAGFLGSAYNPFQVTRDPSDPAF